MYYIIILYVALNEKQKHKSYKLTSLLQINIILMKCLIFIGYIRKKSTISIFTDNILILMNMKGCVKRDTSKLL
jgi:hypothetical protein